MLLLSEEGAQIMLSEEGAQIMTNSGCVWKGLGRRYKSQVLSHSLWIDHTSRTQLGWLPYYLLIFLVSAALCTCAPVQVRLLLASRTLPRLRGMAYINCSEDKTITTLMFSVGMGFKVTM